ncbi:hypothetical protein J2T08_006065 [Neorhizobium galegae]|nr:hypothetical protein [Neorhizobium galegae]
MAPTYASSVRNGTLAAARLHAQLNLRGQVEAQGGGVDVFSAIQTVDLPLLLRPLKGLLGAYLSDPCPGVLVTTERPMSIQRFTAAHELGHFMLRHQPSLDDEESVLRRMPMDNQPAENFQEVEADAFASPSWRHGGRGLRDAPVRRRSIARHMRLQSACVRESRFRPASGRRARPDAQARRKRRRPAALGVSC